MNKRTGEAMIEMANKLIAAIKHSVNDMKK